MTKKELTEQTLRWVRSEAGPHLRSTAYHEAGHAVAQFYLGHEGRHISKVTIISTRRYEGCVRTEYRGGLGFSGAYSELIINLAGMGAEIVQGDYPFGIFRPPRAPSPGQDSSHDLYKARLIAEILTHLWEEPLRAPPERPSRKALQLLREAEEGTFAMLRDPDVWRVVTRVAKLLLRRKTIGQVALRRACSEIQGKGDYWGAQLAYVADEDPATRRKRP